MTVKYNTPTFVRKLQEGDAAAWQEFDEQYRPKIVAYLLKMGVSAEDAEDIYHEALVKVLQRIDRFEPNGHFDRWLRRIAVNQCIDYLRRRRRSPESAWSEDTLQIPANDLEPSRQAQQNELRQKIDEAIASLPSRQRQIAQLRLREGMKFGEIADAIGGDAASLKSMFGKAKKKLQLQLAAYLQAFWLPWRRLKEFALPGATSKSVALPVALAVSLSFHTLLIFSLRHLPQKPESMSNTTSAIVVTVDGFSAGIRGQDHHTPATSAPGRKNRPALKTDSINFVSANSSTSSLGRTSGGGFGSTSSFTLLQPVKVAFPKIQTKVSKMTEFPDVIETQRMSLENTPSVSTIRRQGESARRNEKSSFLGISRNPASTNSLQVDQSAFPSFLYREAEHPDEIKGRFVIGQNAEAFGGRYIVLPKGVPLNEDAIASYRFNVTEAQAGEYYLWGRVLAKNGRSDSFRVSLDSENPQYIWNTGIFQRWTWTVFVTREWKYPYIGNEAPQKIHLTAGEHTLSISVRETDAQLDALLLSRVPAEAGEVTHALPQQPLVEGWVNGIRNSEFGITNYLNEPSQAFTSYIRFGNIISPTLINWPLRRLRFSGQPLELAFSPRYRTYQLSNHRPPKRQLCFYHSRFPENSIIFCLSFGSRSEIFLVTSPAVFLSNENGLLAVQGEIGALGEGFTPLQQRHLRQTLKHGSVRLILLASSQGLPRLRREMEMIIREYEWKALPRSHPLFLYPSKLPEGVSIEGMQLREAIPRIGVQVNKGQTDKIEGEWQVLLVEIVDEKVVSQFLWNLSHFESRAGSLPISPVEVYNPAIGR